MYELHNLIEKMQERQSKFELEYTEQEDLIKVRDTLNKRLVTLRDKLIENPSNQSVMLEYGFLQDEVLRINKRILYLNEKFSTKESKIDKYEKLVNYNLQVLYSYVDFMKQYKLDDKLAEAMQESLIALERNMNKLNELLKED